MKCWRIIDSDTRIENNNEARYMNSLESRQRIIIKRLKIAADTSLRNLSLAWKITHLLYGLSKFPVNIHFAASSA